MSAMYAPVFQLLICTAVTHVSTGNVLSSQNTTNPVLNALTTNQDESLNVLADALSSLSNLTDIQKRVLDQQHAFEQELLIRNREEEARQAARTTALEEDRQFLKGIWGTLSRKLKTLTRSLDKDSQPLNKRPKDCADLYLDGEDASGVYQVWSTWSKNNFSVYCDMETDGGGWTVIHRWGNYSFPQDYFKRTWNEYKTGFGNLETAFWLGNELIYALTSQGGYELRFDLDGHPAKTFAQYRGFWIESVTQNYKAHVEGYVRAGTAGNIFSIDQDNEFTTFDKKGRHCPYSDVRRGWWRNSSCQTKEVFALSFGPFTAEDHNILKNEMKIRPVDFQKMKEIS